MNRKIRKRKWGGSRGLIGDVPVERERNRHYAPEYLEFKCSSRGGTTFVTATPPDDNAIAQYLSDPDEPVHCRGCPGGEAIWTGRRFLGELVSRIIEGEGVEYRETPQELLT